MKRVDIIRHIFLLFLFMGFLTAQDKELEMDNLYQSQLNMAGFKLEKERKIKIKAIGAGGDEKLKTKNEHADASNMYAYCWIVDSKSRKMVWRMTINNTKANNHSKTNRVFEGEIILDEGFYEVYFSAIEPNFFQNSGDFFSIAKFLKKIWKKGNESRNYDKDWEVTITGLDKVYNERIVRKIQNKIKSDIIVKLTEVRDDDAVSAGFTLKKPLKINIYALGERVSGKMHDYGWIIDADSRKKVWTMENEETDHAGGAKKNRMVDADLKLGPGSYLVKYRTDDSHSYQKWNSNPPYDPLSWGITVRPANRNYDPDIIQKFTKERTKPLISMTHIGDYAYKEEAFRLTKKAKIRIFAMGEGPSEEMVDYAWITQAKTGRVVWRMRYRETQHAGGASKNRLFDGVIKLEAGNYIAHYQSDDSHSYEEWNSSKPQNPEMWGLTIYPVGDRSVIERVSRKEVDGSIIAQIVRIGDGEHIRKEFLLNKETQIRVYCIGEGDSDEMYDYGWIENARTGRTVWRMRFRRTEHAGGASKNRVADTIITLEEGRYRVHYRSDDSHSYYDWNDKAPFDQGNWGITLYDVN